MDFTDKRNRFTAVCRYQFILDIIYIGTVSKEMVGTGIIKPEFPITWNQLSGSYNFRKTKHYKY